MAFMVFSRSGWAWLVIATSLLILPAPASFALTVADLVDFLESEVPEELLLRLLDSAGSPEELSPADLVALWEAGASEQLLDRLVPPAPLPEEPLPATQIAPRNAPEGGIRAYYRDVPGGGQVFILTNLDDEGQRLDGRPFSDTRKNLVAGRRLPTAAETSRARLAAENWYPPEPQPVQQPPPEPLTYPTSGPSTFVQTSPYFGFAYSIPASHLYPPGSYTHFKLYHQGGRKAGLGHYQLPAGQIFYQPPFPTAGSHRTNRRLRR